MQPALEEALAPPHRSPPRPDRQWLGLLDKQGRASRGCRSSFLEPPGREATGGGRGVQAPTQDTTFWRADRLTV